MTPDWSVIVPTLNEASNLEACLAAVRAARSPEKIEAIVVDGGGTDETPRLAERLADKVIRSAPGRGGQLRAGAAAARGKMLLFIHADGRLPAGWDEALERNLSEPGVAAAAFSIDYGRREWTFKFVEAVVHLRCKALGIVYGDHGLAVRRETYERAGGFPDQPLFEDVELVRRLRRLGRVVLLPEKIAVSPRRLLERGPLKNAWRNNLLCLRWALGVPAEKLHREYYRP